MAGKQVIGDGLSANIAGMSKNQLYDIMSQMKALSSTVSLNFFFSLLNFLFLQTLAKPIISARHI